MARIPYPDPDDLSPETRELVENLPDLKILSMLAHADDSYSQYLLFVGSLLSRTDLDPHLRELIILRIAAKEEAEYQWVQHEGISKEIGIDDEQIEVEIGEGVKIRQMRQMISEVRAKGEPVKDDGA